MIWLQIFGIWIKVHSVLYICTAYKIKAWRIIFIREYCQELHKSCVTWYCNCYRKVQSNFFSYILFIDIYFTQLQRKKPLFISRNLRKYWPWQTYKPGHNFHRLRGINSSPQAQGARGKMCLNQEVFFLQYSWKVVK